MGLLGWTTTPFTEKPADTSGTESESHCGMLTSGLPPSPSKAKSAVNVLLSPRSCSDTIAASDISQDNFEDIMSDIPSEAKSTKVATSKLELAAEEKVGDMESLKGEDTPDRHTTTISESSSEPSTKENFRMQEDVCPDQPKKAPPQPQSPAPKLKKDISNTKQNLLNEQAEKPTVNHGLSEISNDQIQISKTTNEELFLAKDMEIANLKSANKALFLEKDEEINNLRKKLNETSLKVNVEIEKRKCDVEEHKVKTLQLQNENISKTRDLEILSEKLYKQTQKLETIQELSKGQKEMLKQMAGEKKQLEEGVAKLQEKLHKEDVTLTKIRMLKSDLVELRTIHATNHKDITAKVMKCQEVTQTITSEIRQEMNRFKERTRQIQSHYTSSFKNIKREAGHKVESLVLRTENKVQQSEQQIEELLAHRERVESLVPHLNLFRCDFGGILKGMIEGAVDEGGAKVNFEKKFLEMYPEVTGFDQNSHHIATDKIETMIAKLQDFVTTSLKSDPNGFQKNMVTLNETLQSVVKETQHIKGSYDQSKKMQELIKEKELILLNNEKLLVDMAKRSDDSLTSSESKFTGLIKKVQELQDSERNLQEELRLEKNLAHKFKTSMKEQQQLIFNLRIQSDLQQQQIEASTVQVQSMMGNPSDRITIDQIQAKNPEITSEVYDQLGVSNIDTLSVIELQNIVKNIILLLKVPFAKLTQRVPMIAIYLSHERQAYIRFTNRLHYQFYQHKIPLREFSLDAYNQYRDTRSISDIKHPLTVTLDELCDRIIPKL